MKVTLIAAMANGRLIGRSDTNDLPWKLPEDMAHFKNTTTGRYVVMGRKTWESIPAKFRPLSGRANIVISGQRDYKAEGASVFASLELALRHLDDVVDAEVPVFVIGGARLYQDAIAYASDMVLTRIQANFEPDALSGPVRFPFWHLEHWNRWSLEVRQAQPPNNFEYHIEHWRRIPPVVIDHHPV